MSRKTGIYGALFVFITVFLAYLLTLNPAFHANDSPETIACAYTLGIQHPPGYPLAALAGKIFTFLPAGNMGFRVNMEAGVFGALAAVALFLVLFSALRGRNRGDTDALAASLAGAFCFAFSATFWPEALSAKGGIYTLNAFFLLILALIAFTWERTRQAKYLYLFAFVYGLSLTNHWESMAVAAPAFILFALPALVKDGYYKTLKIRNIALAAVFAALGTTVYCYLLIRARAAFLDWGRPDSLSQLLQVIIREQYADLEKARSMETVGRQVMRMGNQLLSEFGIPGLVIAAAGVKHALDSGRRGRLVFFGALTATILLAIAFYFNLKEDMLWIMDVFMIPVYAALAFLIGMGIYWIADYGLRIAEWKNGHKSKTRNLKPGTGGAIPKSEIRNPKLRNLTIAVLAFALPVYLFVVNYKKCDQSRYFYGYDFGMNIIKSIDAPAIAMLEGDFNVMPQMFFKYVMKKTEFCPVTTLFLYKDWGMLNLRTECPDVKLTATASDNFTARINNVIAMNYREKNIYVSVFRQAFQEYYPQGNAMLSPAGLVMRLAADRKAAAGSAEVNLKKLSYRGLLEDKAAQNSTTRLCLSNYSSAFLELGNAYRTLGIRDRAERWLTRAVTIANEKTKAISYVHLGIFYNPPETAPGVADPDFAHYAKSVELYKKAIEADKNMAEAYSNLAGIYNTVKKYDESIRYAEQAIKIRPDFSEVYNNLAIAYFNKGDRQKAIEAMERSVKLNPANELAKRNLMILKGQIK
jgi:tetratricopeptide (TPR) repeat protein